MGLPQRHYSGNASTTQENPHKTPAAATAKTPGSGLEITVVSPTRNDPGDPAKIVASAPAIRIFTDPEPVTQVCAIPGT